MSVSSGKVSPRSQERNKTFVQTVFPFRNFISYSRRRGVDVSVRNRVS